MARHNKIYAGPFTEATPQVREAPAVASTLPGCLVTMNAAGKFALATAATKGKVWVVQDNYLVQKGVDDAIDADDTAIGMEMLPAQLFNVRVPTATDLKIGDAVSPGADGKVVKASGVSAYVVGFAEETYNNTSGADQLVRIRAATGHVTAGA